MSRLLGKEAYLDQSIETGLPGGQKFSRTICYEWQAIEIVRLSQRNDRSWQPSNRNLRHLLLRRLFNHELSCTDYLRQLRMVGFLALFKT